MNGSNNISIYSILFSSVLVMISLAFSYFQKLKIEKDIIVSVIRASIQLVIVGYLLNYIFGHKNVIFTTFLLIFMIANAAYNTSKRGKEINNVLIIAFIAISISTIVTLFILVFSKVIKYEPYQMIPIGGMIISNSMISLGLSLNQMSSDFKDKKEEVETKLALGANNFQASIDIIRNSVKIGMIPTIDSAKTLGIVALPGMMTGLILAGTSPINAIKYQLIVTFMMLGATAIVSFIGCYLSYNSFLNVSKSYTKTIINHFLNP
ncbi:putative ABC transport system permease protein [Clostridium algifaecis]|uniref:ABC transport system permease protein n=1 Tax=Clostridium algifaecis TaxID=1472040 RepID=A0ABS4KTT6_9CLOT|nr:iron export ABC transporter permease subunit FetB [Clostridium algifaecis]MBP2033447.1 putative ABC transport system permease protein [Clostridium algifaecis]